MQERVDPLSVMVPGVWKTTMLNDLNMHITVQDDALMQQAVVHDAVPDRAWSGSKMWHGGCSNRNGNEQYVMKDSHPCPCPYIISNSR
jgi:hypothetical protein